MHWPVAISGGPLILHRRATGCHPDRSGGICGCFSLPKAHGLHICQAFLLEPACFHQLPFAGYFPCWAHNQIMHTPLQIRATAAPRPVCAVSGLLPGQVVGHAPALRTPKKYPPPPTAPSLRLSRQSRDCAVANKQHIRKTENTHPPLQCFSYVQNACTFFEGNLRYKFAFLRSGPGLSRLIPICGRARQPSALPFLREHFFYSFQRRAACA